jgi:methylsterol monooxygenase
MLKYKTQPGKNQPVDLKKLRHARKMIVFNQLAVSLPMMLLYSLIRARLDCPYKPEDMPSLFTIIRDIAVCTAIEETGFYYSHRLLHWGPFYKAIHKRHHEWTAPLGFVSAYSHPVEHMISNVLVFSIGPILMRSHILTSCLWFAMMLTVTVIQHSGYHLPFLPSPELHDFHHLKFNCNYGVFGPLDWLHGTDALFRESAAYKRHRILFTLTPATELYVDNKTK